MVIRISRLLVAGFAFFGASLAAGEAHAAVGYVCSVWFAPGSSTLGTNGYVDAYYYTGANCTGTQVAHYMYCTSGATYSGCSASSLYVFPRESLIALFHALQSAASVDQKVDVYGTSCMGGGTGCGGQINFKGD